MTKQTITPLLIISFFLILLGIGFGLGWWTGTQQGSKVAYVQSNQVFESFALTKQLQAELENTQQARKAVLDEIGLRLERMSVQDKAAKDSLESLSNDLYARQQRFTEDNRVQAEQYNSQIWTQLNQYMQDFAEAKGYEVLLGATGNGSLLAADEELNVTEELITYVNTRYEGE